MRIQFGFDINTATREGDTHGNEVAMRFIAFASVLICFAAACGLFDHAPALLNQPFALIALIIAGASMAFVVSRS